DLPFLIRNLVSSTFIALSYQNSGVGANVSQRVKFHRQIADDALARQATPINDERFTHRSARFNRLIYAGGTYVGRIFESTCPRYRQRPPGAWNLFIREACSVLPRLFGTHARRN